MATPVQFLKAPAVTVGGGSYKTNQAGTATATTIAPGATHTANAISINGNSAGTADQATLLQGGGGAAKAVPDLQVESMTNLGPSNAPARPMGPRIESGDIVLGGVTLAKRGADFDEARARALLTAAYGTAMPQPAIVHLRCAARTTDTPLASIHVAMMGLPVVADTAAAAWRTQQAERLILKGVPPNAIIETLAPKVAPLTRDYNPNQPRVPGGNANGGQWTADGSYSEPPTAANGSTGTGPSDATPTTPPSVAFLFSSATSVARDVAPGLIERLGGIALDATKFVLERASVPLVIADAIFFPDSGSSSVHEGVVPSRDDYFYKWDRQVIWLEFTANIDGKDVPLTSGRQSGDQYVDSNGRAIAQMVDGGIVMDLGALDDARRALTEAGAPPSPYDGLASKDDAPKLCPLPTPEPKTNTSAAARAYQTYVTGLPYPLAVELSSVRFDGCKETPFTLLEAKANYEFFVDLENPDNWLYWFWGSDTRTKQMRRQSRAAGAVRAGLTNLDSALSGFSA